MSIRNDNDLLWLALKTAWAAHRDQSDKQGEPYIFHVMRVMFRCKTQKERIVALLHDVVEDGNVTLAQLTEHFPADIVEAVDVLTRNKRGETYEAYIERVAANPLARRVKLADLADHLKPSRAAGLTAEDAARLIPRYELAQMRLLYGEDGVA